MSKSLKTIQVISKICRILSTIAFVFCIVGGVGCLIGIFGLAVGAQVASIGGVDIFFQLGEYGDMTVGSIYANMIVGLLACAGSAVVAKFAEVYFKHELQAGTPFTFAGAKEILRLGILSVAIPLGIMFFSGILVGILNMAAGGSVDVNLELGGSVSTGVFFLILSAIFHHGAELSAAENKE